MKKLVNFIIVLILFLSACNVEGQTTVQVYSRINLEQHVVAVEPDINVWTQHYFTKRLGIWGFALVEQNWAEAYGGVLYSPVEGVELTFGMGIEQTTEMYRFSANAFVSKKGFSFLAAFEKGGGQDNWWYKSFLTYSLKKIDLGLMSWRFHGTGPYLSMHFSKNISLWINPGRDLEFGKNRIMFGADIHF